MFYSTLLRHFLESILPKAKTNRGTTTEGEEEEEETQGREGVSRACTECLDGTQSMAGPQGFHRPRSQRRRKGREEPRSEGIPEGGHGAPQERRAGSRAGRTLGRAAAPASPPFTALCGQERATRTGMLSGTLWETCLIRARRLVWGTFTPSFHNQGHRPGWAHSE